MPQFKNARSSMTPEKRYRLIAEAAYFRAARRAFQGGCPLQDWLEAEREIEAGEGPPAPRLRTALVFL